MLSATRKRPYNSMSSEDSDVPPSPASSVGSLEAEVDLRLATATMAVATSGSLTPLLKEEIRAAIQYKRLQRGESELVVEYKEKQKSEEMTNEEVGKRTIRRERNKVAAQKCRMKKKRDADTLEKRKEELELSQEKLKTEVQKLEQERENLFHMLQCHQQVCPLHNMTSATVTQQLNPPPQPPTNRTISESSGFSEMSYFSESPSQQSNDSSFAFLTSDSDDDLKMLLSLNSN
ncbi:cyclic AMP-dependent transcription factor ATF-3-like [Tubulanus polymorphus]|uniref:cyclic AMP-dependent transcription factor ATF-3-like n=1 Tax=Tubulanus polymorphus TaxID=672921 RepID=UPI003DA2BA3B